MSAQEQLQGVSHLGAAASFPWHQGCSLSSFSTGMCHGHHGSAVVTSSSVGGITGISRFCTVQSSQIVHISITYFFYSVHRVFFPFQLPVSLPEFQSACINCLVCLFWMLGHSCPRHNIVAQHFSCCQRIEIVIPQIMFHILKWAASSSVCAFLILQIRSADLACKFKWCH